MGKQLVAYFSASGVTRKVAQRLAAAIGADIFEICPAEKYTEADLDWRDKNSRSTLEMNDPDCRPKTVGSVDNMADYDAVFLGFPIWWGREPSVVDTFIASHDLSGKAVIPFCTSGGGGYGKTSERLRGLLKTSRVAEGIKFSPDASPEELMGWAKEKLG